MVDNPAMAMLNILNSHACESISLQNKPEKSQEKLCTIPLTKQLHFSKEMSGVNLKVMPKLLNRVKVRNRTGPQQKVYFLLLKLQSSHTFRRSLFIIINNVDLNTKGVIIQM